MGSGQADVGEPAGAGCSCGGRRDESPQGGQVVRRQHIQRDPVDVAGAALGVGTARAAGRRHALGEAGTSTKMARLYGRAVRGRRLRAGAPHGHWKNATFVGALRSRA